jgi:putative component of membrane protein insertase Oxa1/YidC/SpoIIIJ protein YidD
VDAIRSFGILRGLALAAWRVVRCNPWSLGGIDRVEEQRLFRSTAARPRPTPPSA